jgi:hypothetical protein
MKTNLRLAGVTLLVSAAVVLSVAASSRAEGPSVAVTGVPADQDTTISIRKGERARSSEPEYHIESGSSPISGDPVMGQQESYEAWKKACNEWKKDMREMNGKGLIALSCGTPTATTDSSGRKTQSSTGTYKIKVRMRDATE